MRSKNKSFVHVEPVHYQWETRSQQGWGASAEKILGGTGGATAHQVRAGKKTHAFAAWEGEEGARIRSANGKECLPVALLSEVALLND